MADNQIALLARAPVFDTPFETQGKALGIQQLMGQVQGQQGQNKIQNLAIQDHQLTTARNTRLAALVASGASDEDLLKGGFYPEVKAMNDAKMSTQTSRFASRFLNGQTTPQTTQDNSQAVDQSLSTLKPGLQGVKDQQGAATFLQKLYSDPVLGPLASGKKPLHQAIADIPQDPQALQQWVQGYNALTAAQVMGQPQAAGTPASGPGGVSSDAIGTDIAFNGGKGISGMINDRTKPTDFAKLLQQAGIDPNSPLGRQVMQQQVAKQNNIPLVSGRSGAPMYDAQGNVVAMAPIIPQNAIPHIENGRVTGVSPLPGASGVVQSNAYSAAAGSAQTKPRTAYVNGQPVFTNDLTAAQGGDPPAAAGVINNDPNAGAREIAAMTKSFDIVKDPASRKLLQEEITRLQGQGQKYGTTLAPELAPGVNEGAKKGQDELSTKGASLMNDAGQTGTVISRLQNIKGLAKAAITGAGSSRLDFLNGVLSLAGIPAATDAKTASDLVDKNVSQVVSALRMGQGGNGTDALQTLLGAANPNRKMTVEAINEATEQLIASQQMIKSKAQLLQPHYLGRDPTKYGQTELQFDQNADPRIWQMQGMTPAQQSQYVRTLPPEVAADMLQKRRALKEMGALK